ncbi:Hypothetical protein LUCI_4863 [Lucifera butyrica]|uniref:Gamma-glutamylcyclotransferase n=1 Tax=Lucifera butyrica TaxID=1351585 RepID=A0A498RKI9_9FIRM|nr:gamma-glutamylcyclotransferase family protein [Lucifera butyrica]VBB09568.1 Hypothetical protein LUCI_4863 [Lucifera butyrica]
MKRDFRHYFAYGVNMNIEVLRQKEVNPRCIGVVRLAGYRVGFYGYSAIWDGAVETVIKDARADVWGVLYALRFSECEQLDECEDTRIDGAGNYFHYPVEVIDIDNKIQDAIIYKKSILGEPALPSQEYLNIIIQGAKKQGVPKEYLAILENTAMKPASYAVPRYPKRGWKRIVSDECKVCEELIKKNRQAWIKNNFRC